MDNKSNIIKDSDIVKVRVIKDEAILHNINTCNKRATIKRISGGRHINVRTGEIVEETKQVNRGDCLYNLIQSNIQLQDLIKENTINLNKILLITLTYKEKVLDTHKIGEDFKLFMKKLRRNIVEFGKIEFINVYELNKDRQGYHIHAILFFNESKRKVFVPLIRIYNLWGNGAVTVGAPNGFGYYYYLTPYLHLSNADNTEDNHMQEKAKRQMELPAGLNLYRHSKGIKKPLIFTDTYENTKQYLKEKAYIFTTEIKYPNPMQTYNGNQLYYSKQIYRRNKDNINKRTPI